MWDLGTKNGNDLDHVCLGVRVRCTGLVLLCLSSCGLKHEMNVYQEQLIATPTDSSEFVILIRISGIAVDWRESQEELGSY